MFEKFPKKRPALPPEYAKIYEEQYKSNRGGETVASSASQRMESWLHKKVAEDSSPNLSTLEIGAGNLNQLKYETIGNEYDVVEPFKALYEDVPAKAKIRKIYDFIEDIDLANKYDRVTSCAVFEHIDNLPYVVAKSGLLLKSDGCLRTAVPSEGGFLWKCGYSLTTGLEFKLHYKLNYSVLMKYEHLNTLDEIHEVLKYFYRKVTVKRLGIGKHFSLYTFLLAKEPILDRCKEYCKQ